MKKILFVCTGNICRSPAAEAILRAKAQAAGISIAVDSAGTGGWHSGERPDPRTLEAAKRHGYDMSGITARPITGDDLTGFDHIYAMTGEHLRHIQQLARAADVSAQNAALFLSVINRERAQNVPDPYYGGASGFDEMFALLEDGCDAIMRQLKGGGEN